MKVRNPLSVTQKRARIVIVPVKYNGMEFDRLAEMSPEKDCWW